MGFEQEGFDTFWINEVDPKFLHLYQEAHKKWLHRRHRKVVDPYIESDSIEELTASQIMWRAFKQRRPKIFGIVGGPPCPDFSNAGRHEGHLGENGRLTKNFIDLICEIKPTFFVLENVSGMVKFVKHHKFLKKIIKQLEEAGFIIDSEVLNALEHGIPQHRERLFLIGFRKKLVNRYLKKTGRELSDHWFPWPENRLYRDAATRFDWPGTSTFGRRLSKPKNIPMKLCVGAYIVPHQYRNKVPNANQVFNAYSSKFYSVSEGDTSKKSFKRLHRYRYSPTVCYGNREVHLHPWLPRRLSLREAMRLQGIPESYVLPENISLSPAFKMISNGVPFPMASYVARSIKKVLETAL